MEPFKRHLWPRIIESLDAFRVVVLHGARQSGKTTLARMVSSERGGTYVSLDDEATLEAALADPRTFLTSQPYPLAVDEIQLGGDRLIRMVKQLVDEDAAKGRFLLTGSTNFLTVPTISESLAGRARILRLWPLSEAELAATPSPIIDQWVDNPPNRPAETPDRDDYLTRLCRGGYPEVVALDPHMRSAWFESYAETVIQRDLVALADIRRSAELPHLLQWAASITSHDLNVTTAARDLDLNRATIVSYLEWLQTVFLLSELPAWSRNLRSRATHRPKVHITDTGLAAALLDLNPRALSPPTAPNTGSLLESFVVNEIARQASAAPSRIRLSHYRDHRGHEVDLVLEGRNGTIVAIEIKASSSPSASGLRHIEWLRDKVDATSPELFRSGVLLHTGTQSLTLGDRLYLRPISALWAAAD